MNAARFDDDIGEHDWRRSEVLVGRGPSSEPRFRTQLRLRPTDYQGMGICISYQGTLKDVGLLADLVDKLRLVCVVMGWSHRELDEGHDGLRGISVLVHPQCDWLHLHFDPVGRLVNVLYWALVQDEDCRARLFGMLRASQHEMALIMGDDWSALDPDTIDLSTAVRYNWVKTQFAGPAAHVTLCRLLSWLREMYLPDLEVTDESGYYATGDLAALERRLTRGPKRESN